MTPQAFLHIEQRRADGVASNPQRPVFYAQARRAARRFHTHGLPVRKCLAGEGIRHQGRETINGMAVRAQGHKSRRSLVTQKGNQSVTRFGDPAWRS